jgi:hypothetical protein
MDPVEYLESLISNVTKMPVQKNELELLKRFIELDRVRKEAALLASIAQTGL